MYIGQLYDSFCPRDLCKQEQPTLLSVNQDIAKLCKCYINIPKKTAAFSSLTKFQLRTRAVNLFLKYIYQKDEKQENNCVMQDFAYGLSHAGIEAHER